MEKPFVLVADDNEATCTLISALLREEFRVDIAQDGMDAIAKLKSRQYAVILLDLRMPLVDGYAVLDFLREENAALLPRVLVVTASLAPREMERVRQYAVCRVVAKPFEVDDLLALVRQCAASSGDDDGGRTPLITTGMLLLLADLLRARLL